MLIVIGVLVAFIIGLLFWKNYSANFFASPKPGQVNNPAAANTPAASIEAGKKATENLVDELKKEAENPQPGSLVKEVTVDRVVDGKVVKEQAVSVAEGTSPISVATGEVIAATGEAAQNSAAVGSQSSPAQSLLYVDPNKLPPSAIKLILNSNNSIAPNSFMVHPGQAVSLAVVNNTPRSEIVGFDDQSLAAIIFSLFPNSTQAITFNAPMKTGEYIFASEIATQRASGMQGKMIVQ
jgi:hypothetical protein